MNRGQNATQTTPTWQPPQQGCYKINVDAAIDAKADLAGIGILIRNAEEEVMVASTCRIPFFTDVEFTEVIAVQKGIDFAIDTGLIPGR